MALLESINSAITGIRAAKAMLDGVKAVEQKVQVAELNNKLAEILNALTDSMMDVNRLTIENMELQQKLSHKDDISTFTLNDGYLINPANPSIAYCFKCREEKGKKSVMTEHPHDIQNLIGQKYYCTTCKHTAGTPKQPKLVL